MDRQTLERYYELQTILLRLQRRRTELADELKEAKYDLRSRDDLLLNYQGSLRSLLDKFSGKQAEKLEALRGHVRRAEAQLAALQREQSELEERLARTQEEMKGLPDVEDLRRSMEDREWALPEAKFCAGALAPLLEENRKALLEYRSLMQGSHPEILSPQRQQEIYAEPNVWAEQCLPYLRRLKQALEILEIPFEMGSYYEAPTAYLVNVAAMHNRRDRVNQALSQVEAIQKILRKYQ